MAKYKLTIHSEITTPDNEHQAVIDSLALFNRMDKAKLNIMCGMALRFAESCPIAAVGAIIAIGATIVQGKISCISQTIEDDSQSTTE